MDLINTNHIRKPASAKVNGCTGKAKTHQRYESLIDLDDSIEVPSDPQTFNTTYEDLERKAVQREKEQKRKLATNRDKKKQAESGVIGVEILHNPQKHNLQEIQTTDVGEQAFRDEPGKFSGQPPKSRTITKKEKEVLNKTRENLAPSIEYIGQCIALPPLQERQDKLRYYEYPDRKAHQYSVEYLLKLRYKCTLDVSPDFLVLLDDICLGSNMRGPDVYWYFDFISRTTDGTFILNLIRSLYWPTTGPTPHNQKPEFSDRRTMLISGGEDFADLIAEQLSEMGTGRQVAVVHGDRSAQDNKTQATAFRNGARNILVCTFPWAQQFLEENVGQIVIYRTQGKNQTAGQARKAINLLVADIESAKATDKLKRSVMARVVLGPDEGSVAKSVAKKLTHVGARCVTPIDLVERIFPLDPQSREEAFLTPLPEQRKAGARQH